MKTSTAAVCLLLALSMLSAADSTVGSAQNFASPSVRGYLRDIGSLGAPQRKPAVPIDLAVVPALAGGRLEQARSAARKSPASETVEPHDGVIDLGSARVSSQLAPADEMSPATAAAANPRDASAADPRAIMTSPRDGDRLTSSQTFRWERGYQPFEYYLWIGSCQDCTDIYDGSVGLATSWTVQLPTDGRAIYVTLFTNYQGVWWWYDYRYTAAGGARPAEMISPANGATLTATQQFTWSEGASVSEYYLWVGSCRDCTDILDESNGRNRSRTVRIPSDGRMIYVTLFSYIGSDWRWFDYTYRAPSRPDDSVQSVTVRVTNSLALAIDVAVNGRVIGSVPAGETRSESVNVASLELSWTVQQPRPGDRAIGDYMSGTFNRIDNPRGTYQFSVTNVVGDTWFFMPLLTNRSSVALSVEVNGGWEHENRCNCSAGPGTENVQFGYYYYFRNSNVRAYRSTSNYTGRYLFWGVDPREGGNQLSIDSDSGVARLQTTVAP